MTYCFYARDTGTKFAARLLKDGYLIKVDATHGVVTILQKGEPA